MTWGRVSDDNHGENYGGAFYRSNGYSGEWVDNVWLKWNSDSLVYIKREL